MAKRSRKTASSRVRAPRRRRVGASRSAARATDRRVLLIVLVADAADLERVVSVLIDLGIAASVVESKPLSNVLRNELPIFSGLASLLPAKPEGRLVLSLTTAQDADRAAALLAAGIAEGPSLLVASIALR